MRIVLGIMLGLALLCQPALADRPALNGDQTLPNIGTAKIRVRQYVADGRYHAELTEVAGQARRYLEENLARFEGEKPAVVLDIDETSVSNWEEIDRCDFGYLAERWDAWVAAAKAPPLPATLEFYQYALARGVAVFFITARPEIEREATERLLRQAGYSQFQELLLKPDGDNSSSVVHKAGSRRKITEMGYTIVVNMGDQQTDLDGGYAEATFKLPNPMYLVP